jgi:hypothetical protein
VKKIPFSIELFGTNFTGYLYTTDTNDPPKSFFIFIQNYIVGDLNFNKKWIFTQNKGNKVLRPLNTGEKEIFKKITNEMLNDAELESDVNDICKRQPGK